MPNIFVLQYVVQLALFPSVFYAPVKLSGGTLFFLFLILSSVAVVSILAEPSLGLLEVGPGSLRKRPFLEESFYHLRP